MHPIAHATIAATVIASALGAFVLCLLVFRYGFEPPDDESLEAKHRRYFVTRMGHAVGAVFFAITAGLAAIALGLPTPKAAEAPRPVERVTFAPAEDLATLRAEHLRLGEVVHGLGQSVQGLGERVGRAEAAAQRLIAMMSAKTEDKPAPRASTAGTSRPTSAIRPTPVIVPVPRPVSAAPTMPVAATPPVPRSSQPASPQTGPRPEPPLPSALALAAAAPTPHPTPPTPPTIPAQTLSAASAPPVVATDSTTTEPREGVADRRTEPARSFTSEAVRFGEALVRSFANATRTVRQFVHDLSLD